MLARHRILIALGVWTALGAGAFALSHAAAGIWTIDDAEITYTYARSLIRGDGFSVSPEGMRVEGFSNPLMLIVATAATALSPLDPFLFHRVLEPLEFGLLLFLVWSLLGKAIPGHPARAALLTAAFAAFELLTPATAIWYGSGLENLQLTLTLVFVVYRIHAALAGAPRVWLDALAIVLVALARPEGLLYAAAASLAAVVHSWRTHDHKRRGFFLRALAGSWMVVAGVIVVGLALRWGLFAAVLPNTFPAKVHQGARPLPGLSTLRNLLTYAGAAAFASFGLLVPVAPALRGLKLLLVLVIPAALALPVVAGTDWMGEYRFGTTYLAAVHLLFVVVLAGARPLAWATRFRRPAVVLVATTVLALAPVVPLARMHARLPQFYDGQRAVVDNVMDLQGFVRVDIQRHLGLFDPVVALGDAGGSSMVGKMQLIDILALMDFHIPRVRIDPALICRYQHDERALDIVVWHGAGTLARNVLGREMVEVAIVDNSPRTFHARRDLVVFDPLPAGARPLGQRGALRLWASPATVWLAAPGAYARIELVLQIAESAPPAGLPAPGHLGLRLVERGAVSYRGAFDEEQLPILGVTAGGVVPAPPRSRLHHRQGFLLRVPERPGRYPVILAGVPPEPDLAVGEVVVTPPSALGGHDIDRVVGDGTVPLVERAQRLAQLEEQLQPRRPRADIKRDLDEFRGLARARSWDLLPVSRRLMQDFAAVPPRPPPLAARADEIRRLAATEVARALAGAHESHRTEASVATDLVAAGRLAEQLRRRRVIGILDVGDETRNLYGTARARVLAFADPVERYRALVGLTLLDPRDMHLQRALRDLRPRALGRPLDAARSACDGA